jgi:16S rRNA (guanine966-N2)-methyltransferase
VRIIGGAFRGRRLRSALGAATRPTSDRVREAIASALDARSAFVDARVLDAFAGTAALGLEAISRGSAQLLAVDDDRKAAQCARENVKALGVADRARVLELDLLGALDKVALALAKSGVAPFSLVFADPPYAQAQQAVQRLAELHARGLFAPQALFVIEHAARAIPERPPGFVETSTYRYGDTGVLLWETIAPSPKS